MRGFGVFMGKEMYEIARTWRIWVLPLMMVFIGLSSPALAKITPDLVASLATEQPGVVIEIPDPVTADAYLQFVKNATQIALLAVIISTAGMVASEKRSGTAILMLTKPLSRPGMVLAKVLSNWVLLAGATVLGALLCVGVTIAIFDSTLVTEFSTAAAVWFVLAAMYIACMSLLSVLFGSQGGAAGAGVGLFLVFSILSAWGPAVDYSPAGLVPAQGALLMGESVELFWPVISALALSGLAILAAALVFRRQEL